MEKTKFKLGKIELGNKAYVTDPSYSVGTWCQVCVCNMKSGKYNAFMNKANIPNWGRVVVELWVNYENTKEEFPNTLVSMERIGVDTGAAGIFDMEYYEKYHPIYDTPDGKKWYDRQFDLRYNYDIDGNKMKHDGTDQKEMRDGVAIDGKCCVSFSGYGDGSYDLYAEIDENDEVVSLGIRFLTIFDEE